MKRAILSKLHYIFSFLLILTISLNSSHLSAQSGSGRQKSSKGTPGYLILASEATHSQPGWGEVVQKLKERHRAEVLYYTEHPAELLAELKARDPRYIAVVELPQRLDVKFVVELNRLARSIVPGPFADFLWGIITGYNASYALRMVENSGQKFTIKTALNTTGESSSGNLYHNFAWLDDGSKYFWGYKKGAKSQVVKEDIDQYSFLKLFTQEYVALEPDLIISSSHATEETLEMPFSKGNIRCKDGQLYADFCIPYFLPQHTKPRVYFAAGNCLIGNMNRTNQSMASAWLSGGGATSMIGYTVTTWYGRAGWGALKYWISNPGNLTLAQANYLNQQEMLYILGQWDPRFHTLNYEFTADPSKTEMEAIAEKALGFKISKDQLGFWHDRDVLCFYGDPAWDVRVADVIEGPNFTTSHKKIKGGLEITVTTSASYTPLKAKGAGIKEIHVNDLPFALFFNERLEAPKSVEIREAAGAKKSIAHLFVEQESNNFLLNRDFLLLYNPPFEPNKRYLITIK